MGLDSKILTTPRITIGKLFSKKVPSLKLLTTFSASVLKEIASTISWDDQMSAKESRDLVFRAENTPKSAQRPQCQDC